jgi:hypothetical protein
LRLREKVDGKEEGEMITPETAIWAIVVVAVLAVVVIVYRGDRMPNVES